MNEEKEKGKEKKAGGKAAGSIRQWGATLGAPAHAQASEHSEVEESERSDAQASGGLAAQEPGHPDAQASGILAAQEPEHLNAERSEVEASSGSGAGAAKRSATRTAKRPAVQPSRRSSAQASDKEQRNKQTVYLELDVDRWIRHRVADTREEISDVINLAVRQLMKKLS